MSASSSQQHKPGESSSSLPPPHHPFLFSTRFGMVLFSFTAIFLLLILRFNLAMALVCMTKTEVVGTNGTFPGTYTTLSGTNGSFPGSKTTLSGSAPEGASTADTCVRKQNLDL